MIESASTWACQPQEVQETYVYLTVEYQRGAIEHVVDAFTTHEKAQAKADVLQAGVGTHHDIHYGVIKRRLR